MARGRYKGAIPLDPMANYRPYGPGHPVYRTINLGDPWIDAWVCQYPRKRRISIDLARWEDLRRGANVTRAEVETMAAHWQVPVGDVIASLPRADLMKDD